MSALSELGKLRGRGKEETPDNVAGYLFLLPWLIGLVLITIGPIIFLKSSLRYLLSSFSFLFIMLYYFFEVANI